MLPVTYHSLSVLAFGCVCKRFFVESIVFLEDIKSVEMYYLQAQVLISQVGVMRASYLFVVCNFACLIR